MLIPDMLLYCIITERGLECFPVINKRSVRTKRYWQNKTPEEKAEFSKMRSKVQKETFKKHPKLRKIRAESFRKVTKSYWDNIEEEKKKTHIKKMSKGMKEAWDKGDENFGPRISNKRNVVELNGNIEVEDDLPRINDYCGVLTESQLAELNG